MVTSALRKFPGTKCLWGSTVAEQVDRQENVSVLSSIVCFHVTIHEPILLPVQELHAYRALHDHYKRTFHASGYHDPILTQLPYYITMMLF
jgi:hypothetical protein